MVARTMRALAMAAFLGIVASAGCASGFHRVEVLPPAEANGASPASPYVQVRELGVSHKVVLFHFNGLWQLAVTVDVRNRSTAPLTLDTAGAALDLAQLCNATRARAAAVASGAGDLPGRVDLEGAAARAVTIGPGEDRSFWIVFERVEWSSGCTRVSLRLPSSTGETFLVESLDPSTAAPAPASPEPSTSSPAPSARPPRAFGLSIGLQDEDFGSAADIIQVRESLWYARGALKGGLSFEAGRLFEKTSAGLQQASTLGAALSLSWRPPLVTAGLFAAGQVTYASFENPGLVGNRGWPDLSAGVEIPVQPGPLPAAFARLGYTRVFDDRTPYRNALLFSIDTPYAIW
jgi:hypothetical protein